MIDDVRPRHPAPRPAPRPPAKPEQREPREPDEPRFRTPEQVAREPLRFRQHTPDETIEIEPLKPKTKPQRRFSPIAWWRRRSKKQKIIILVITVLVLAGLGTGGWILIKHRHEPHKLTHLSLKVTPQTPKANTVASDLTGLQVNPAVNQRPVTGVMIENTDDARPQSGLDQAGVVFEAVAEAGITRFLALYQDTAPSYIGPVRSARPYYLQWCLEFDCDYAHVGGSPDALNDIADWNVKNLDQFYNADAYQRIDSRDAPHNVYTSMAALNQLESSKGFGAASFTSWPRKAEQPAKTVTAGSIDLSPSSPDFAVHYNYDKTINSYIRSEGGAPHTEVDANGNLNGITPKVVIAMQIPQSDGALDSSGAYYTEYASVGSGPVHIFQDGMAIAGTWSKGSNNAQIEFKDGSSNPIKLDAGQTWITVIGDSSDLSYSP